MMLGHEAVKAAVLDVLQTNVPDRLDAIRTALAVTSPVDPATYVAADSLTVATEFPVVLVRSTSMGTLRAAGTVDPGSESTWVGRYDVEVVVACDSATHGDYAAACADRDRLLLAVREVLLLTSGVGDIELLTANLAEDTGAAAETLRGAPLAAGSITLSALATETLAPLAGAATETWDATDQTVTAYSASESI